MSDSEAIALLARGDIGGLEILVKQYYVQAAFLRVFERIHQFDTTRPFAPWFLRSVVNDALMSARKQGRLVSMDSALADNNTQALAMTSPDKNLDEMLIAAETSEAIWVALGKLSAEQRSAIVLRYYLDLSEAEMSNELEVAPGTVKSRLHTARRRPQQLLPTWLGPSAED